MTGDRKLQSHELRAFMQHHRIGWDTIKELLFVGGEPSLFEVAFIEIMAKLDAHTDVIINQGAQIKGLKDYGLLTESLRSNVMLALKRLDELDESLEEHKQLLTDQMEELKQLAE